MVLIDSWALTKGIKYTFGVVIFFSSEESTWCVTYRKKTTKRNVLSHSCVFNANKTTMPHCMETSHLLYIVSNLLSADYTEWNIHNHGSMFVWLHHSIKLKYSMCLLCCSICISLQFTLSIIVIFGHFGNFKILNWILKSVGVSRAGLHNAHLKHICQPVA